MTATYRMAREPEVAAMLDWAAAEGWNPGLEDAAAFWRADHEGFFLAEVDRLPVAAISVVNHGPDLAFLGLYLCQPAFRGRGIGYGLWRHALAHAGSRVVGLDGVAAQEANYARSGFVRTGASLRFEGRLEPADDPSIRPRHAGDDAAIFALDQGANGYARRAFLSGWIADLPTRKTVVLAVQDRVAGFATIRACRSGAKIGPVVAPDAESALSLMRASVAALPTDKVVVDVPLANDALTQSLVARGFGETFATARMFRGRPPVSGPALQAIATMELG